MEWQRQIDGYCERTSAAFWAEPLNAVTNAGFILAAVVALVILRREARQDVGALWLVALITAIGVGSFLFHTVATVWAALADVLPITLFILSFLALTLRRFFKTSWWLALLLTLLFLPTSEALSGLVDRLAGDALGGSEGYLPALLALLGCGLVLDRRGHPMGRVLLAAGGLFLVSLTFRTLDEPLCALLPMGTHFIWHLLNSLLLGGLVLGLIRHSRPSLSAA